MSASNNNNIGGRFLIQDSNHLSETPDLGGRFMIQDHDHNVQQAQAGESEGEGADRQQGGEQPTKKSRRGRQYL